MSMAVRHGFMLVARYGTLFTMVVVFLLPPCLFFQSV